MVLLKYVTTAALTAACLCGTSAQRAPGMQGTPKALEVEALVDAARVLPVEYKADILFRLVEASKVSLTEEKLALFEELFDQAGQAKAVLPLRGIYSGVLHPLRLDAVSIRCRVLRLLAAHQPDWVVIRFQEVLPSIKAPRVGCNTLLVYDPSPVETTLERVLGLLRPGERPAYLTAYATRISSGVEIPGLVGILLGSAYPSEILQIASIIAGKLASIEDCDRAFVLATGGAKDGGLSLIERVAELADKVAGQGFSPEPLLRSLRSYLARQLVLKRCADTADGSPRGRSAAEIAKLFNSAASSRNLGLEPLEPEQLQPAELLPGAGTETLPVSSEVRGCLTGLRRLRERDPEAADRGSWENTLESCVQVLRRPDTIKASEDLQEDTVRAAAYRALLDQTPPSVAAGEFVEEYVTIFENARWRSENPGEWLNAFQLLLDFARKLDAGTEGEFGKLRKRGVIIPGLPSPHGRLILQRLRASRDPVLAAYAWLEELAPLSWGQR